MSRRGLALYIMVDALGARFLREREFLPEMEFRTSLRTVIGYSCSCEPTILTGRLPREHGHGAMYMLADGPSVLGVARKYRWLPAFVRENHRIRSRIHAEVAANVGGYFSLYECPTRLMPRFDLVEPKCIFEPGGFRNVSGIFDDLQRLNVPWRSYYWNRTEEENIASAEAVIRDGAADWILLYLPALDGLLHAEGLQGEGVAHHLAWYEQRIRRLLDLATQRTDDFDCFIFSDHGMSDVTGSVDVLTPVERAFGRNGDRYLAFYDSTMARFWVEDDVLRAELIGLLGEMPSGRVLSDAELASNGSDFADRSQGDVHFMVEEGTLILPSYMGRSMLAGMHGYHPDARWADACLLGLSAPPQEPTHLRDVYSLMLDSARRLAPSGGGEGH